MKFFQYLLISITLFICAIITAQENVYNIKDSIYIRRLITEAGKYNSRNIDSAERDARNALLLSQKIGNINLEIHSRSALAIILAQKKGKENLEEARYHFTANLPLSRSIGDSTASFSFVNNMSNVYVSMKNYPKALKYALQSVVLSKQLKKDKEAKLGISYNTLGKIYWDANLRDSALFSYKKAKYHFKKIQSPYEYYIDGTIGEVYLLQENYDEGYVYLKYAYDKLKEADNNFEFTRISNLLGTLLLKMEDANRAKQYYEEALKIGNKKDYKNLQIKSFFGLAKVFYVEKKMDSAGFYIDKALKHIKALELIEDKVEILELKADILSGKGKAKEALGYYNLSKNLNDSLAELKNIPETTNILVQHQNKTNEEKVSTMQRILAKKNKWIIVITVLLLFLGGLSYFFIKKYRKRLDVSHKNKEVLEISLQSEKDNNAYINRKLVAATANLALKTDLLSQIHELLGQIKNQPAQNLTKEINETQTQIKIQKNMDTMWKEFFTHFEEVHPEFLKDLKSRYAITQHDLKICAFLKMNLSNKEICQLMNINPTTVRVNIHRIKKKLKIPKESSVVEFFSVN